MSSTLIKKQLVAALQGGQAHLGLDDAVANFPSKYFNQLIPGGTYTPWHLLEHIRITQRDILDYITSDHYHELSWPHDYWPDLKSQTQPRHWQHTIDQIHADTQTLIDLINSPDTNVTSPLSPGSPHNLLREVLLIVAHTGYHLGEFAILRQVMHTWSPNHL